MIKKLIERYSSIFFLASIGCIWLIIAIANYEPGTWLIGWDSLLPEINLGLNIRRSIFAAWQDVQGLGLAGGIGHASELTRQLFLAVLSIFFPVDMLRYIWTYIMLLIGPIGVFFLANEFIRQLEPLSAIASLRKKMARYVKRTLRSPQLENKTNLVVLRNTAAFFASLYYLLNLAMVQNFYVPLEAFSSFYGCIPWLLLIFLRTLTTPTAKNLLILLAINLAATSAFHVQTMFIVYGIVLSLFAVPYIFSQVGSVRKQAMTTSLKIACVILATHLFWLAPVGYFTLTNAQQTVESKQNRIATPESQAQNRAYGTLFNIAQLKGYWFDYSDENFDSDEPFYLLEHWKDWTEQPLMQFLLLLTYAGVVCGVIGAVYIYSSWKTVGLALNMLFASTMLTAGNGLLGGIFTSFVTIVPLLEQIFRVPFTKWSVVLSLWYALGIGFLALFVLQKLELAVFKRAAVVILIACIAAPVFPLFSGKLFYQNITQEIPPAYFELFSYLQQQSSDKRILHLPLDNLWGWTNQSWGYRGSGFIWYGIEQPIIDRNFDVWSKNNETLYRQLDLALLAQNYTEAHNLLKMYGVSYIFVDQSLTDDSSAIETAQDFANYGLANDILTLAWTQDSLQLYEVLTAHTTELSATIPHHIPQPTTELTQNTVYKAVGHHIESAENQSLVFPLLSLQKERLDTISITESNVRVPFSIQETGFLHISAIRDNAIGLPATFLYEPDANAVSLQLKSPLSILSDGSETPIFSAENLRYEIPDITSDTVILDVAGQVITLKANEQQDVWLSNIQLNAPTQLVITSDEFVTITDNVIAISDTLAIEEISAEILTNMLSARTIELEPNEYEFVIHALAIPLNFAGNNQAALNCDPRQRGSFEKKSAGGDSVVYISDEFAQACDGRTSFFNNPDLDVILTVSSENTTNNPLKLYLAEGDTTLFEHTLHADQSAFGIHASKMLADTYSQEKPPLTVNILNTSFGQPTQNSIHEAQLLSLPLTLEWLSGLQLTTGQEKIRSQMQSAVVFKKHANFWYSTNITATQPGVALVLQQGYDSGWIAFADGVIGGTKLSHYRHNGWANAWLLPERNTTVTIVYWPQLLIFAGYITLLMSAAVLVKKHYT